MLDTTHIVSAVAVVASFLIGYRFGNKITANDAGKGGHDATKNAASKKEEENVSSIISAFNNSKIIKVAFFYDSRFSPISAASTR